MQPQHGLTVQAIATLVLFALFPVAVLAAAQIPDYQRLIDEAFIVDRIESAINTPSSTSISPSFSNEVWGYSTRSFKRACKTFGKARLEW